MILIYTFLAMDNNNLQNVFQVIKHFEKRSGFKVNYNKTTVYRIGSLKNSNVQMYCSEQLSWTKQPINVLGALATVNKNELIPINITPIMEKAQRYTECMEILRG